MYDSVAVAARPRAVEMVIPMVDVVRTVVDLQFVTAVAASSGALDGPAHDVIDTAADPDEHLVLGTHRLRDVGLEGEADDAALERRERKACRIDLDARRSGAVAWISIFDDSMLQFVMRSRRVAVLPAQTCVVTGPC